jgi:ferredoxin
LAYVIAEPCIGTKDNSCTEVCPVDCIHPIPDEEGYESSEQLFIDPTEQLFIDPTEWIDCDACVEACLVDAIFSSDQLPPKWAEYEARNAAHFGGSSEPG